jgi:hypothetical protein
LITLIILGVEYKLWSSSLCSCLQPHVTYLSMVQIFSSTPCPHTPSVYVRNQVSHPYKTTGKFLICSISTSFDFWNQLKSTFSPTLIHNCK